MLCLFWLLTGYIAAEAQERSPELIRLPKQATSPQFGVRPGATIGPAGREWLVLNGATFPNKEYPDLARTLRENYAQQNYTLPNLDVTPLPDMGS